MLKTDPKRAIPDCAICGTLFFGNPLAQRAESLVNPSGRWDWVCEGCCRVRNQADAALHRVARDRHPVFKGKNCGRCGEPQKEWAIQQRAYQWVCYHGEWSFHCKRCYDQYQAQQYAYPCGLELLHCADCLFVIAEGVAKEAGWYVIPSTGEAYCFYCKLEPGRDGVDGVPLSCTSIPQESHRADQAGRLEVRWVILLTQILTLVAIGLNLQSFTLLLVCASTVMVTVKQFARGEKLKELLAKKRVQM